MSVSESPGAAQREGSIVSEPDELTRCRETNKRLNRRCQELERGVAAKIEETKLAGSSLGRGLANAAATMYELRADRLEVALKEIAAFAEGDTVTGSFDEPHAARIARKALANAALDNIWEEWRERAALPPQQETK